MQINVVHTHYQIVVISFNLDVKHLFPFCTRYRLDVIVQIVSEFLHFSNKNLYQCHEYEDIFLYSTVVFIYDTNFGYVMKVQILNFCRLIVHVCVKYYLSVEIFLYRWWIEYHFFTVCHKIMLIMNFYAVDFLSTLCFVRSYYSYTVVVIFQKCNFCVQYFLIKFIHLHVIVVYYANDWIHYFSDDYFSVCVKIDNY